MQSFKDYVIQEFKSQAETYAAVEFKFSHAVGSKLDKKSELIMKVDYIKVGIKFYDKDMNLLISKMLTFENNEVPKSIAKKLVNISPDELANRFNEARNEICSVIMNEYNTKRDDLEEKIKELRIYTGSNGDVIPDKFKGESLVIENSFAAEKPSTKKKGTNFDM